MLEHHLLSLVGNHPNERYDTCNKDAHTHEQAPGIIILMNRSGTANQKNVFFALLGSTGGNLIDECHPVSRTEILNLIRERLPRFLRQ